MLTNYLIPSESMYKAVIHVTQDLLKNQVVSPITQEFHIISSLCLEYKQTLCVDFLFCCIIKQLVDSLEQNFGLILCSVMYSSARCES